MTARANQLLRAIPSVGEVLTSPEVRSLVARFGEGAVKLEVRQLIEELRQRMRTQAGPDGGVLAEADATSTASLASQLEPRLIRLLEPIGRRAINATGILLHTGLGRAPLCREAAEAMAQTTNYSILQASLDRGDRSLREERIQRLLIELVGCEAATVVNNNAAATMLILNSLCSGKEVIISRGQLIEIGGSFRMTDVMGQSGAILREVGTTNRTHLRDYESAIGPNTGAIIHVHTSNYRIRGFTGTPAIGELCQLGRKHNVPVIDDLGSGAIVELREFGISNEPLVRDSVAAGSDVVCFSGDKLICGPQSGIICGKKAIIERIRKNPFARMFRVCKLTLAGLEATLPKFLNGSYKQAIPFYRMLCRDLASLDADAQVVAAAFRGQAGLSVSIEDDLAYVGSGSIPDEGIQTKVVCLAHRDVSSDALANRLRRGLPSVFGRLRDRQLILDMRTLLDGEREILIDALKRALAEGVC